MKTFASRLWLSLITLACAWAVWLVLGRKIASNVAAFLGTALTRLADGKVVSPESFIHGRMQEALWLVTAGVALIALVAGVDFLGRRAPWYVRGRGIWLGLTIFVALNLGVLAAQRTVLFWMPFYAEFAVDTYAQFQIKSRLLSENGGIRQAILVGNSCVGSNLDEKRINLELRNKMWTTELSQSGICGLDLRFIADELKNTRAFCAVTYVSSLFFASLPNGQAATRFVKFNEVPDLLRNAGWNSFPEGALRSGLIGRVLPLFHHNVSFSQRVLGGTIKELAQGRFDMSLEKDLDFQSRRRVNSLKVTDETEAQRRGFEQAMEQLADRCTHVVIIVGTPYPLMDELRPEFRTKMLTDLAELQKRRPNIILVDQDDIMPPKPTDFMDIVHFNKEAQARFSALFAEWLYERLLKQ